MDFQTYGKAKVEIVTILQLKKSTSILTIFLHEIVTILQLKKSTSILTIFLHENIIFKT